MDYKYIIKFLKDREALSITQIEKESGIPLTTLHHLIAGRKKRLAAKYLPKLRKTLIKYGCDENLFLPIS
jgi:predicted transcriptional regulator